jgi:molecular chaperone GrpE (heat shock protein)
MFIFLNKSLRKDREEYYLKIKELIAFSVSPKFIEVSPSLSDLTDFAIEIWRIEQKISKCSSLLPENQQIGLETSIQRFKRYLERQDIEIIDYTGKKFNEGLNLDVLSIEKNSSSSESIIKETVEPTIMCKGQLIRKAKIILLNP